MTAMPLLITVLCLMAIAYRYYSAFLAAKVAAIDDARPTPAITQADGQNYHSTNRWVLFGHHFAAISGSGPLIGPVLAAQFGYLPGLLWIIIGVCLAGAVQDFLALSMSIRRRGRSLAQIATDDIGPVAGTAATIAILFILVIALAGLGRVVVAALAGGDGQRGSSWGVFTIGATIPIALFVGLYMYKIRPGKVLEASLIGGALTLVATFAGGWVSHQAWGHAFELSDANVTLAMAIYGFVASVLPVWILLTPRDYLSSFLKIGTIALLVVGTMLANPTLHAPAINHVFTRSGPIVAGPIFPFLFITIMCGAISGFHALVSTGTTSKMIAREKDARMIGFGAMLIEGLVAVVAIIAATALPTGDYFAMNTLPKDMAQYKDQIRMVNVAGGSTIFLITNRARRNPSAGGPAARSRWRSAWPASSTAPPAESGPGAPAPSMASGSTGITSPSCSRRCSSSPPSTPARASADFCSRKSPGGSTPNSAGPTGGRARSSVRR